MRPLMFIILFTFSSIANAGCAYIGEIQNDKFGIDISDGGCGPEVTISFWRVNKNGSHSEYKTVPFAKECFLTQNGINVKNIKNHDGSYDGLQCHPNGRTPLAGATFKLTKFGRSRNSCAEKGELGSKYVCVKGCGKPAVPEYINGDDGSC